MPLKDKGVLSGKNIKIYRERGINGATEEFLYEDGNNAANVAETSYIKGFNYLGITGENIAPVGKDKTVAFYVDSVLHSQKVMPQYLLYVDRDTIAAGKWCNTGEHGYNHEGDSQTHQIVYNALSYGRVLVNLNDSVKLYDGTSNNMLENGLKYGFENYVRLGFVPAIHINIGEKDDSSAFAQFMKPGEWLIVLKGTTFDALKSKVAGSENIIDPVAVDSAKAKGLVDFMPLDGNHQNYAFSFRYTDDAHENFLMESQGYLPWAYPGCFWEASWVKIQNNVPVLAQCINPWNGEHTQIYGMDELKETINQSQIFKLKTTDEIATANESLAAANVQVIAGNGVVTVKNAAGKKLVITNILGKVIANTVVTSDNATFAAPAGIVAVAVEGEPAVKAIVK
jgi:predicted secreted protein